jgi:hypothetical protein
MKLDRQASPLAGFGDFLQHLLFEFRTPNQPGEVFCLVEFQFCSMGCSLCRNDVNPGGLRAFGIEVRWHGV